MVTVAFRGVRKAEGKNRGFLVELRGAHPLCDGNSAEVCEKEGVAGHQRVGCVELVQDFDERKGVAELAVRARRTGSLRR